MRYTRIGLASYGIAFVLVATVVGVAWARSRESPSSQPAGQQSGVPGERSATAGTGEGLELGGEQAIDSVAYQVECSGCHGAGEARGSRIPALREFAVELFTSEGGREYLIDFMLDGRVRTIANGQIVYEPSHPSYGSLSDPQIAGILNYMLTSWGNEAAMPPGWRPFDAEEIAASRPTP